MTQDRPETTKGRGGGRGGERWRTRPTFPPPPPPTFASLSERLTRVYVDGAYGIGKSSALRVLTTELLGGIPCVVTPEPMLYWREFFVDLVAAVGDAGRAGLMEREKRLEKGNGSPRTGAADLVGEAFVSLQMKFADPYLLLHDRLGKSFGPRNVFPGDPGAAIFFDRHVLASTACFPAARFLNGDCEADCFLSLLIKTPEEPPGCNLLIADLRDTDEHVRRLAKRGRAGEDADVGVLRALRTSYAMLVRSVDYANAERRGHGPRVSISDEEWDEVPLLTEERRRALARGTDIDGSPLFERGDEPRLSETLVSLLKTPVMCDSRGKVRRVHRWAAESFLTKLRGVYAVVLSMDGKSPEECAREIAESIDSMSTTRCQTASLKEIFVNLEEYSSEVDAAARKG